MSDIRACKRCKKEFVFQPDAPPNLKSCPECRLSDARYDVKGARQQYSERAKELYLNWQGEVKERDRDIALLKARLDERDKLYDLIMEIRGS